MDKFRFKLAVARWWLELAALESFGFWDKLLIACVLPLFGSAGKRLGVFVFYTVFRDWSFLIFLSRFLAGTGGCEVVWWGAFFPF